MNKIYKNSNTKTLINQLGENKIRLQSSQTRQADNEESLTQYMKQIADGYSADLQ